ncbi:MAG: hypothetical protein O7G88_21575 [bacterium]|nr:hypothetical protein [bacterium]
MSSYIPSSLQGSTLQNFFQPRSTMHTESAAQLKTSTRAKMDFTLTTAEGDKVTLSAKSVSRIAYTTYDAQGRLHGMPDIHAESLSVRARQEVTVMVEGDLNAEELADIEKLFDRLLNIATDFFTGDLDQALDGTLAIDDLGSIASFGASLKLHQRISVAQSTATYATYERRNHLPTTAADTTSGGTALAIPSSLDPIVDDMMQAVDESKVAAPRLGQRLSGLVSELFEKLAEQLDLDATGRQRVARVSTRFAQRLKLTVQANGESDESTETVAAAPTQTTESTEPEPTGSQSNTDGRLNILL